MTAPTLKDLLKMRDEVAMKIADARSKEIEKILAVINDLGITQDELFKPVRGKKVDAAGGLSKVTKAVPPKYTDGVNFWSGRGKAPRWVATAKENGSFKEL